MFFQILYNNTAKFLYIFQVIRFDKHTHFICIEMKSLAFLILSAILSLLCNPLSAQIKPIKDNNMSVTNRQQFTRFRDDHDKYIEDLKVNVLPRFLSKEYKEYKEIQAIVDRFSEYWNNTFSTQTKDNVIITSNLMLKRKIAGVPYYTGYMENLMLFYDVKFNENNLIEWEKGIHKLVNDQNILVNDIKKYFDFTHLLLADSVLFQQGNIVKWKVDNNNFTFMEGEPVKVYYQSVNLSCLAKGDTMTISNTGGYVIPFKNMWFGKSGLVMWPEVQGPPEAQANLANYRIDLRYSAFSADTVTCVTRKYGTLRGHLDYTMEPSRKSRNPEFVSYDSVAIHNIRPQINYYGGISLAGSELICKGLENRKVYLEVVSEDNTKRLMSVSGYLFQISKAQQLFRSPPVEKGAPPVVDTLNFDVIVGEDVNAVLHLDSGSLSHGRVNFRYENYQDTSRYVYLRIQDKGIGLRPFRDSYHNLDIYSNELKWKLSTRQVHFRRSPGPASSFTGTVSSDFFDPVLYQKLQYIDQTNPLVIMRDYADKFKTKDFTDKKVQLFAKPKRTIEQIREMLLLLEFYNFVEFDPVTGQGKILPRLYDFLAARDGKKDFDNILFLPKLTEENSSVAFSRGMTLNTYNLDNNSMAVYFVDSIPVSNIRRVIAYPTDSTITIQSDRDFTFNGLLATEFFEFEGKNFKFIYKDFRFDLDSIRFLSIKMFSQDTVATVAVRGDATFVARLHRGAFVNSKEERDAYAGTQESSRLYPVNPFFDKSMLVPIGKDIYIPLTWVKSRIENVSGCLYVDDPGNKSGSKLKEFTEYPKFDCTKESYIFYDQYWQKSGSDWESEERWDRVYNPDKFKLTLRPFSVDSISVFDASKWRTNGYFESGIMSSFDQIVSLQSDSVKNEFDEWSQVYSLGFFRPTQKEPYSIYNDQASVRGELKLSVNGLHAQHARFNYLNSYALASDFVLFPEVLVGDVDTVIINSKPSPPQTADLFGTNSFLEYWEKSDSLIVTSTMQLHHRKNEDADSASNYWTYIGDYINQKKLRGKFEMYNGRTELSGASSLSKRRHLGWGYMEFQNSILSDVDMDVTDPAKGGWDLLDMPHDIFNSTPFVFSADFYDIDTADFQVRAPAERPNLPYAFKASNMDVHINYDQLQGVFKSNGELSVAEFPVNQYITNVRDLFIWDIEDKEIEFGTSKEKWDGKSSRLGSEFVSQHPAQDSLKWTSYFSGYSLTDYIIRAYEVDSINVADMTVYPAGIVTVRENANMEKLDGVVVRGDTIHRTHLLYEAWTQIRGKHEFTGSGKYDYAFFTGKDTVVQTIVFEDIHSKREEPLSYGAGRITSDLGFDLNTHFIDYIGSVRLVSNSEDLEFTGSVKIVNPCETPVSTSISFLGFINPDSAVIPYTTDPSDALGKKIQSGFYFTEDSLYTAFLSSRRPEAYKDTAILPSFGILYYHPENLEYQIASPEKIANPALPENMIALSGRYCYMRGDGDLNLGLRLEPVSLKTIGSIKNDLQKNETSSAFSLALDFFFNDKALNYMVEDLMNDVTLSPADYANDSYARTLSYLGDSAKINEMNLDLLQGKVPDALRHTMFFTEVKFKWYPEAYAFRSEGPINLSSINNQVVGKQLGGYIEIVKNKAVNEINMYLEIGPGDWYYFSYNQSGKLIAVSSNEDFNNTIKNLKDSERKPKEKTPVPYEFMLGNDVIKDEFLSKITGKPIEDDNFSDPDNDNVTDDPTDEDVENEDVESEDVIDEGEDDFETP